MIAGVDFYQASPPDPRYPDGLDVDPSDGA